MGTSKQSSAYNFFQSSASSNNRSLPNLIRPRRSRETNYIPPSGDSRRRGFVLSDEEVINEPVTPVKKMWLPTSKEAIRRQYSDCWWALNAKDESEHLNGHSLQEPSDPPSPSPVLKSLSAGEYFVVEEPPPQDMCNSTRPGSPSSAEISYSSFARRKKLPLATPCRAGTRLYYNDLPSSPPNCPLPSLPPSAGPESPTRSAIKKVSSAISKALDQNKPSSPQRPKHQLRPVSFVTPETRKKTTLVSSLPAPRRCLSPNKYSRSCITPDLKRTGISAVHSFVRPGSNTPKLPVETRHWNIYEANALHPGLPQSCHNSTGRPSSSASTYDPFRADPVTIQRPRNSKGPSCSAAEEPAEAPATPTGKVFGEDSDDSTSHSTPPSSVSSSSPRPSATSCGHDVNAESPGSPLGKTGKGSMVQCPNDLPAPAETFIFAPLRSLDGFFGNHPRRRTGLPAGAFTLRISPGPSSTTFGPGDRLKINLMPGHTHYEEIRVAIIGTTSSRRSREVHEFVRVEKIVEEEMSEIELAIPLRRSCECPECEHANDVLPGSLVNEEVFISYHLSVRGVKKARWTRDERVQVSLMVKGYEDGKKRV